MITSLGIGILVGTSLIVIIPEGADAMYSISTGSGVGSAVDAFGGDKDMGEKVDANSEGLGSRRSIGLALITGYLLMYLIDKVPNSWGGLVGLVKNRGFNGGHNRFNMGIDMSNLRFTSLGGNGNNSSDTERGVGSGDSSQSVKSSSTSIGLIIHAIADGVALGASVSTESTALETIIFLAIMIHKAPASFGLTTVLIGSGLPLNKVKRDLIAFAAAAPVGAILTYFLISILGSNDSQLIQWWTGALLVFSGGTFLYVAVHAMSELHDVNSPLNSLEYGPSSNNSGSSIEPGMDLLLSSIGMLIPLITFLVPDV